MAKTKSVFFCGNCGYESPKWQGKCPSCGEWNQFKEETVQKKSESAAPHMAGAASESAPQKLDEVEVSAAARMPLEDAELNRVLGGGLVPGSMVLIGGEPGIGKSTLLLQAAVRYANAPVLYVSGEE
ncbi:MAG: AAA family ATPase, partial [Cryomorphaceae bacterium]